jgi:hypothetical protein
MLIVVLLLVAFAITLGAGVGRAPLWPAVLIGLLAGLLAHWPAAWR